MEITIQRGTASMKLSGRTTNNLGALQYHPPEPVSREFLEDLANVFDDHGCDDFAVGLRREMKVFREAQARKRDEAIATANAAREVLGEWA